MNKTKKSGKAHSKTKKSKGSKSPTPTPTPATEPVENSSSGLGGNFTGGKRRSRKNGKK